MKVINFRKDKSAKVVIRRLKVCESINSQSKSPRDYRLADFLGLLVLFVLFSLFYLVLCAAFGRLCLSYQSCYLGQLRESKT